MIASRLRDGKVIAVVLVVALAVVVLFAQFAPTRSAFSAKLADSSNTAATAKDFTCTGAIDDDLSGAVFAYKLGEATNAKTAADWSGKAANGTYQGTMTATTPSPNACPRDAGSSYALNGTNAFVSTPTAQKNPTTFSEEVWFRTTVAGGMLIGFGGNQVATSGQHDRQTYINAAGQLVFGAYNGATQVVTSPGTVTDGAWHHVVATMSAATGMRLYLDGALVASNSAYTTPENYTGYWRVGYDTVSGWPGQPNNFFFSGSIRFAAVYSTVLTQAQVTNHYVSSR